MAAKKKSSSRKGREQSRVHVFVDEIGDVGKTLRAGTSKIFGFGVSVVSDLDEFAKVSQEIKTKKDLKGKMKARRLSIEEKTASAIRIRRSGAKISGVYVDKTKDVPKGWIEQSGKDAQIGMLRKTLDLTLSKIKAEDVTVIVDDHRSYHEKDNTNHVKNMEDGLKKRHGKNVTCDTNDRTSDPVHNARIKGYADNM